MTVTVKNEVNKSFAAVLPRPIVITLLLLSATFAQRYLIPEIDLTLRVYRNHVH